MNRGVIPLLQWYNRDAPILKPVSSIVWFFNGMSKSKKEDNDEDKIILNHPLKFNYFKACVLIVISGIKCNLNVYYTCHAKKINNSLETKIDFMFLFPQRSKLVERD